MTQGVKVIGIAGTNGSGKDAVGLLLAERHNYLFISVSNLLREELARRGLSTGRNNTRDLSAQWRREFGLSVLVDRAIEAYEKTGDTYSGLVIASLRNPFEADRVHEIGGTVIWMDADPEVRYARVSANKRVGRTDDDNKSFEQFVADEEAEMHGTGDAASLDMSAVKERSDITVLNNSSDLSQLEETVMRVLGMPASA